MREEEGERWEQEQEYNTKVSWKVEVTVEVIGAPEGVGAEFGKSLSLLTPIEVAPAGSA